MAEFTDDDKRVLDQLRKAVLERRSGTLSTLQPWQEATGHQTAVLSDKGAVPADVVRGLSGSWAASYAYDLGGSVVSAGGVDGQTRAEVGLPMRAQSTRLGLAGVPEVNFPLYREHTNVFGPKGPALIGSPISFEVVGPTLKSPACDWTWEVSIGTGANGGDEFIMSIRADGDPATCATISAAYNQTNFTIGDLNEPNGGLYLVISDDGSSDGALPAGVSPLSALDFYRSSARYEIFRVASVFNDGVEIHPNKTVSTYFLTGGTRGVKGIMLVRPYATRLAALPSQRRGREQNFAVVAPQRAASGDTYPPYDGGVAGDGTWLQGGFTALTAPGSGNAAGLGVLYMGRQALPIPIPVGEYEGVVESGAGTTPASPVGIWRITLSSPPPVSLIRQVVQVYQVTRIEEDSKFLYGSSQACLGWFEVRGVGVDGVTLLLARMPETDPITGRTFYGPGPYVQLPGLGTREVKVYFTAYRQITDLYTGAICADDIEASRLAPLLAPSWSERTQKGRTGAVTGLPQGSSRGRPDKAIFDTRTYSAPGGGLPSPANPGNLLDLGFRMVLFPAKEDPGTGLAVPDYTKPITSREVVIDPAITDPQYLEVDYDAGMVRLSHPPPSTAGGDIVPNGIIVDATSNIRGEVVLFACMVPYTREATQRGMGPQVTTQTGGVFSVPVQANIFAALTNYDPAPPYFGPSLVLPNPVEVVLDQLWQGPPTGVVEILEGGVGGRSFGLWSYTGFRTVTTGPSLVSALSLVASSPQAVDPTPATGETRTVILRREVDQGLASPSQTFAVDDYLTDRGYGQALRASALRLPRDRVVMDLDGTVSMLSGPAYSWAEKTIGYLGPSRLPFPPRDPTLGTPVESYFCETGLFGGLDYEVPGADPRAPTPGGPFRRQFEGSSIELSANQPPTNWHGILTFPDQGIIRLNHGFRLSARFKIEFDSLVQRANVFIGFVQDEGGGGLGPSVEQATSGAGMVQNLSAVGLFVQGSVGDFKFWGRGSNGGVATDRFISTGIPCDVTSTVAGPFTFVMETLPYPSVSVRYGMFDDTGKLLSTARISLRTHLPSVLGGSNGLVFIEGIKILGENPPVNLQVYHTSLTQRFGDFDLPFLP